jgi:hypothetical protein
MSLKIISQNGSWAELMWWVYCKNTYLANKTVASLGEGYNRGGSAATFSIGDDRRLTTFHGSDSRVCGTEINTHNLYTQRKHKVRLIVENSRHILE